MDHETTLAPHTLARLALADPPAEAFAELDAWARPRLGRYFGAAGFSRADADDLVQQTLLRLLHGRPQLRDPLRLVPWLFAIARRVRGEAWARHRVERLRERHAPDVESLCVAAAPEDLERRVGARRQLARLKDAIATLPAQQQFCLVLRVGHELPYEEIAAVLRLSLHTVRNHLAAARRTLRARLSCPRRALRPAARRLRAAVARLTPAGNGW